MPAPTRGTYDTSTIPGYGLYTTAHFPFQALFELAHNWPPEEENAVKDALDYWSAVLAPTVRETVNQPSDLSTDGDNYAPNPLFPGSTNAYVIRVNRFVSPPPGWSTVDWGNVLGYASPTEILIQPGTNHHLLPYAGYFVLNGSLAATEITRTTPSGKSPVYYTCVHEIAHALGIGTTWHLVVSGGTQLLRSFIVGAGDNSSNLTRTTAGNVFYTTTRGSRTATDIGVNFPNLGSSEFTYAYNDNSTVDPISPAIAAYNECFNTSLTAIPLENGAGDGSYAGHWLEGRDDYSGSIPYGLDERQYYGDPLGGAIGLGDELMTPQGDIVDMAISRITLGALVDLGWSVDMSLADNYEPLVHPIRVHPTDPDTWGTDKNRFGSYFYNTNTTAKDGARLHAHLRFGCTYRFPNNTDASELFIWDIDNNIQVTDGVNYISASNELVWSVPAWFPSTYIAITDAAGSPMDKGDTFKSKKVSYWQVIGSSVPLSSPTPTPTVTPTATEIFAATVTPTATPTITPTVTPTYVPPPPSVYISCDSVIDFPTVATTSIVLFYILPASPNRVLKFLYYNMYSAPDQIDVIVDGVVVKSTGGIVSGGGTLALDDISNDKDITIKITREDGSSIGYFEIVCEKRGKVCCPVTPI